METAVIGTVAVIAMVLSAKKTPVDICVEAFYADKYNGLKYPSSSPDLTFVKCMAENYPEKFEAAKKKYGPKPEELK